MKFEKTISKELVAELPQAHFDHRIIVVESEDAVDAACEYLMSRKVIGFDTETRPSFKAGSTNKVALLQLSSEDRCYLFRLCSMSLDRRIIKVLESDKVKKIGVAIKEDLRALRALRHFKEREFVDLQSIAGDYGIEELSLRKMGAITLGIRVSKAQRLSNWEAMELTLQQKQYAATDAWVSLMIYKRLKNEL